MWYFINRCREIPFPFACPKSVDVQVSASRLLGTQRADQRHVSRADDYWLNARAGVMWIMWMGEGDKVERLKGKFQVGLIFVLFTIMPGLYSYIVLNKFIAGNVASVKYVRWSLLGFKKNTLKTMLNLKIITHTLRHQSSQTNSLFQQCAHFQYSLQIKWFR